MATRSLDGRAVAPALLLGMLIALLPQFDSSAREIISFDSMVRGTTVTQAQCAARRDAIWAVAHGRGYCMRYYISTAGGEGNQPVVHLSGDKLGRVNIKTGQIRPDSDGKDVDTRRLIKRIDAISKQARTTAIYLARVGIDGSSGHHSIRHSYLELHVTNAALDAIKRRHQFVGFHLVGQSGGAGLVGGLLPLRQDIGCAVPGSGRLAILKNKDTSLPPILRRFDPADDIPKIVGSRTRILVVTDPDDKTVKRKHQTSFVRKLRDAGGRVELFYVDSSDRKSHHGVTAYAGLVVGGCVRGQSHGEIAKRLAELVAKRQGRGAADLTTLGRDNKRATRRP
jgi:hypothetical protein